MVRRVVAADNNCLFTALAYLFEGDDAPGIWGEYSTELSSAQSRIQMLPDSTPLGDMRVKSLAVTPETLSTGVWPSDYTISDHAMVEAVFVGKCLEMVAQEGEEEALLLASRRRPRSLPNIAQLSAFSFLVAGVI